MAEATTMAAIAANVTNQTCDDDSDGNCTNYDYYDVIAFERIVSIIVPVVFSIIVLIGLVGNLLVIIVVVFNPQMRNTTNVLIISLALSDLSFIVLCVPFTATDYALPRWPFGDAWCKVVQYMIHVCAYASVYSLVLMSLDRFLAVVHPITSMSIRTTRNSWIAVVVLWAVICLGNIPNFWFFGNVEYMFIHEQRSSCNMKFKERSEDMRIFYACFLLLAYFIPLFAIIILYTLMMNRLWYGVTPGGTISSESLRSKKRVTRMVVVVVIIFALCWLPIQVIFLLKHIVRIEFAGKKVIYFQIGSQCLAYMNSCVNPILYAFLSDNFRKGFKKVLCCGDLRRTHIRTYTDFERTDARTALTATSNVLGNNHNKINKENMINDHQV